MNIEEIQIMSENIYDIIIIGGGCAGLTAAVYARRAGKTVLLLENNSFGGQISFGRGGKFPRIYEYKRCGVV